MHSGEVRQILAPGSQEDAAVQMIQKLNCFRKIVNGNIIAALAVMRKQPTYQITFYCTISPECCQGLCIDTIDTAKNSV